MVSTGLAVRLSGDEIQPSGSVLFKRIRAWLQVKKNTIAWPTELVQTFLSGMAREIPSAGEEGPKIWQISLEFASPDRFTKGIGSNRSNYRIGPKGQLIIELFAQGDTSQVSANEVKCLAGDALGLYALYVASKNPSRPVPLAHEVRSETVDP